MGDAGPNILNPPADNQNVSTEAWVSDINVRDIHVLVTGFGAFKSFSNNPSYLIASSLSKHLDSLPPESLAASSVLSSSAATATPAAQPTQHPLAALLGRPAILQPRAPEPPLVPQPIRTSNRIPYRIHIHSWPTPLYVAYASTSTLIPSLLDPRTNHPYGIDFDYVLHIGLASGRDSYTLETNAHRDEYDIQDVDDQKGYLPGEKIWKHLDPPIPERLDVGWLPTDVLAKWEAEVDRRQTIMERGLDRVLAEMSRGDVSTREQLLTSNSLRQRLIQGPNKGQYLRRPRRAVVKLSRDAGRYLCEFILMCSLVYRYRDARGDFESQDTEQSSDDVDMDTAENNSASNTGENSDSSLGRPRESASEKIGKVAFLHVPNGTEPEDIERGKMVAESAIQALVASWEAGYRNPQVYAHRNLIDRANLAIMGEDIDVPTSTPDPERRTLAPLNLQGIDGSKAAADSGFETKGTGDS